MTTKKKKAANNRLDERSVDGDRGKSRLRDKPKECLGAKVRTSM